MNIQPFQFGNAFLNTAHNFLALQMQRSQRQADTTQAAIENSQAFTAAAIMTSNNYFYSLAKVQTNYSNTLGLKYADVAKRAVKKMGSGGVLGMFGL